MAACWRCGTQAPSDANFCPNCGVAVTEQGRDLAADAEPTSVGGEHVVAADPAPSRWLLLVAVALLGGLVAFFVVIGGDGEPSADPYEERSDFDVIDGPDGTRDGLPAPDAEPRIETIDDPEPDEPIETTAGEIVGALEWQTTMTDGVGFPTAMIDIGDSTFVFSVAPTQPWSNLGPAHGYRRGADGTWEDLGVVIDADAEINGVWPGADGALATGLDSAGDPTLWRTTDGISWTAESLPPVGDEPLGAVPRVAAEVDGVTMVIGAPQDPWGQMITVLRELYPETWEALQPQFNGELSSILTVRGPFGIVIDEFEMADVGLDPEVFSNHVWGETPAPTWRNIGDGWTTDSLAPALYGLLATDSQLFGVSDNGLGPEVRMFDRGVWADPVRFRGVWMIEPWGDRFVGATHANGISVFDAAGDLLERVEIPDSSAVAHVSNLAAGDAGLVVAESIWETSEEPDRADRIVVLRDGYTLEVDGQLSLSRDGETILRSSEFWRTDSDRYTVDGDRGELLVTFLSEDGEPLVSFTLAELVDLERATYGPFQSNERARVVFTPDGASWHGGDFQVEGGQGFTSPHLTDDRIIAAQLQGDGHAWYPLDEDHRFMIIEAVLPD